MVSYWKDLVWVQYQKVVLILIIVEDGLVQCRLAQIRLEERVLILIVVENGLVRVHALAYASFIKS